MLVLPGFIIMCFTAPRFLYDCQFEEWETAAANPVSMMCVLFIILYRRFGVLFRSRKKIKEHLFELSRFGAAAAAAVVVVPCLFVICSPFLSISSPLCIFSPIH